MTPLVSSAVDEIWGSVKGGNTRRMAVTKSHVSNPYTPAACSCHHGHQYITIVTAVSTGQPLKGKLVKSRVHVSCDEACCSGSHFMLIPRSGNISKNTSAGHPPRRIGLKSRNRHCAAARHPMHAHRSTQHQHAK